MPEANRGTIIITGADGMLARAFMEQLGAGAIGLGRGDCDVTEREAVLSLSKFSPKAIIHCAANVNADDCELNQDQCQQVQLEGTQNVIDLANECGAKLFYPQSFLIFDGKQNSITEETRPNPLSWYGRCKLEAAEEVLRQRPDSLVVQMGGFFGGGPTDKNFVGKFVPHIIGLINKGETMIEIGDRVWQPTYTRDLAKNSLSLIEQGKNGVYNMACHGSASFFEIAVACVDFLGLSSRIDIVRVSADKVQRSEAAARPSVAIMENFRLKTEGLDQQRPWREALKDYLNDDYFKELVKNIEPA